MAAAVAAERQESERKLTELRDEKEMVTTQLLKYREKVHTHSHREKLCVRVIDTHIFYQQ